MGFWLPVEYIATGIVLVALSFVTRLLLKHKRLPLPPGPPGLPLVGNLYDWPKDHEWLAYQRWGQEFGSDIIALKLCGTSVIVLNTAQVAFDLFERRSAIYSDRPRNVMLRELIGWDYHFAFMEYGEPWRVRRRALHQHFNPSASRNLRPNLIKGTHELLIGFLKTPEDFLFHIAHMAGSVIMDISYGLQVLPKDDPYIAAAQKTVDSATAAANTGAYLVDCVPILKYIPGWFPGAGFKRQATDWRNALEDSINLPADAVKEAMGANNAQPSMYLSMLQKLSDTDSSVDDKFCREVVATAYVNGVDTTVSAIQSFVLAMLMYPDVQKKAQNELDRVVGLDRLPEFSDQPSLPYITGVTQETLRWNPVTPLAVAHKLTVDDEYNGFHIPAGSIVVGNAWAMLHDEQRFPDPKEFKPERFLKADGQLDPAMHDAELAAFGFGRRICPGRHMSVDSIWVTIASILSTFTITKAVDEHENTIEPSGEFSAGFVSHPLPFKCTLTPRFAAAESLVRVTRVD